MTKPNVQMMS